SGMGIFWAYRLDRLEAQAAEQALEQSIADAPVGDIEEPVVVQAEPESPTLGELIDEEVDDRPIPVFVRKEKSGPDWLDRVPFLLFVSYWAILTMIGYTLAGEKMPWLGTHLTLPLIFLAGWYFGRVFEKIDWQKFRQGGWLYLVLLPLLFVTLFQVIMP